MRRAPLIASFILFLLLISSLAYWAMQLFAPPPRPVVAPPQSFSQQVPPIAAAASIFGGRSSGKTMINVQLRGVVLAGRVKDSVAILVAEDGAPQPLRLEDEVLPGVKVQAIHPRYVVLSDHGVLREVSLPEFAAAGAMTNAVPTSNARVHAQPLPEVSAGASVGALTGHSADAVVPQGQPQIQLQPQAQPSNQPGNAQPSGSRQRQEFPQPVAPVR